MTDSAAESPPPTTKNLEPYEGKLRQYIGTSGFPMAFKNYPLAAQLAKSLDMHLYAILPDSRHANVQNVAYEIMRLCPGSVVDTSYPTHGRILDILSQCAFSLFPYRHETTGIGGSARVGVGAQRPVVITNVIRFLDWVTDYKDEFYVIEDPYPTFASAYPVVKQVLEDVRNKRERIPVRTLQDQNWRKVAAQYVQVYRELMAS